ncbi:MAG: hypothetical protein A4E55_00550 [Pelotomaculum sp. PtaU1.Bin035]|nr:MAG: hypothetical protein A4E55_00550 [Pelotomaculum sp. PtaU1.Bin035]
MSWLLLLVPLAVAYYTCTYGWWALKNGYRRGGIGAIALAAFVMALAVYGLFLNSEF